MNTQIIPNEYGYELKTNDTTIEIHPEPGRDWPEQRTAMHEDDILCKPSPTLNRLKLIQRVHDCE